MDVHPTAWVLTGGDPVGPDLGSELPPARWVLAADSGLSLAATMGVMVDVVVGDMDSVEPALLADAEAAGARLERHPIDKDATDLELAVAAAVGLGAGRVVVVGGHGGRLDHLLANAFLLAAPGLAGLQMEWWVNGFRVVAVRREAELHGSPGDVVTLLPVGGTASGITTSGLRWPLHNEQLEAGSTRGVSNVMTTGAAAVSVRDGVVLAIHHRSQL